MDLVNLFVYGRSVAQAPVEESIGARCSGDKVVRTVSYHNTNVLVNQCVVNV
jgi:hypothetical protein